MAVRANQTRSSQSQWGLEVACQYIWEEKVGKEGANKSLLTLKNSDLSYNHSCLWVQGSTVAAEFPFSLAVQMLEE